MLSSGDSNIVNNVPMTCFDGVGGSKLHLINTLEEWAAFYELLMKEELVACDTETSGFNYFKDARICGLSFGWRQDHFYIPLRHLDSLLGGTQPAQLRIEDIKDDLIAFFAQQNVLTIWHNWKFDAHFYRVEGIEILTPFHDTSILWTFFDENAPRALKIIASGWVDSLGRKQPGIVDPKANEYEKLLNLWRQNESRERRRKYTIFLKEQATELAKDPQYQAVSKVALKTVAHTLPVALVHPLRHHSKEDIHYGFIPIEMMTKYAALDTYFTWRVYDYVMSNMVMGERLQSLYLNELELSRVIMETESTGVKVDRPYLHQLGAKYDLQIQMLQVRIKETMGDINLNSNQQLAVALQEQGVVLASRTASGAWCVDSKVLTKLAKKYDIVNDILELRGLIKLKGTYVDGIIDKLTDDDILHCSFNQNVTTGRMSSGNPNLQNIPAKDTSIRRAFINPGEDWVYVFCDYSQVEVRLTADYSLDPLLLDAYSKQQDVHTRTMCEMFGHTYDVAAPVLAAKDASDPLYFDPLRATYKDLRNIAKRINFGIIYGVGAPGLSEQIPRPDAFKTYTEAAWVRECQKYIDNYLDKYRGVKKFISRGSRAVQQYSQLENKFGRIRHLPHANASKILKDPSKRWLESRAKRQGVNFLVQGTAADLFKTAVVRVFKLLNGYLSKIVNFVHDEIQIYLHKTELHLLPKIKEVMEDFKFAVPIIADIEWSTTNWAEKKDL